ncbi:MAG: putative PHD type zinc finger protein with BAH domain-containing protein [Chaenotheca gracillima]|nr:MAG: putative PHD type zinc finger protein with BAH domain-containing protein [Chaenotheca gracillima]
MPRHEYQTPASLRARGSVTHSAPRGGIQKSRGGTRIDKDGDLNMDGSSVRGRGRGRGDRGSGSGAALQNAIVRGLASGSARVDDRRGAPISERATNSLARRGRGRDPRHEPLVQLRVRGLKESKAAANPDGGMDNLLSFLERKASGQDANTRDAVRITKSREQGDEVIIQVKSHDAPRILRLDTFTFAGAQLEIKEDHARTSPSRRPDPPPNEKQSESTAHVKKVLTEILNRRYDPNGKFLNLSALGKDSELVGMGAFNRASTASKFFPALMRICDDHFSTPDEKRAAIVSISLADNELKNLSLVTSLAQTFPDIQNLDLSNNKFENMAALTGWRWRFKSLDHLILSGNPLEQVEPDFASTVRRWYPALRLLDSQQIRTSAEAAANIERYEGKFPVKDDPLPIQIGSFKDEGQIGENFLKQFFPGYDNDRAALVNMFYDKESTFSFNVNTSAPRGNNVEKLGPKSWEDYIKGSRNLMKITHLPSRLTRLHRGPEEILKCFGTLPATRHPNLVGDEHAWLLECRSIPSVPDPTGQFAGGVDGLLVCVHGEFHEMISTNQNIIKRSFDRTFILGPGGPAGVRIVSDVLTLRAYGGSACFTPHVMKDEPPAVQQPLQQLPPQQLPAQLPPNPGIAQQPQPAQESGPQELMVLEFCRQTSLTPQYSSMCLEQNGWDFDKAMTAFQSARGNLPPDAFA